MTLLHTSVTPLPSIRPRQAQQRHRYSVLGNIVFDGNQEANKVMEKSRVHKEVHATSGLSLPRSMWQRRSHICFLLTTLPSFFVSSPSSDSFSFNLTVPRFPLHIYFINSQSKTPSEAPKPGESAAAFPVRRALRPSVHLVCCLFTQK